MSTEGEGSGKIRRIPKEDRERILQTLTDDIDESIRQSEEFKQLEALKKETLSMNPWYAVTGWGAVSPAGWSAHALREAVAAQVELPVKVERRCEGAPERRFRTVPNLGAAPEWMKQPRFRRTTAIARYAVHAAVEALGESRLARMQSGEERVGIVFCSMNGCVQFSRRFFTEVRDNPSLASPILFPETVYNAPSSHLAALLGSREINYTLVGDSAQFVVGLELATQWLEDGIVDACLVVAAEEADWLTDEALALFEKQCIAAEGAAAVLLETRTQENDTAPLLQEINAVYTYGAGMSRAVAARNVKKGLAGCAEGLYGEHAVLCDGLGASRRTDKAERVAWQLWEGPRVSVRRTLGEGFAVTSGWQTVAGLEWIREGRARQALVSAVGLSQQAEKSMQEPRELQARASA
jgi:hypothetical protein